MTHEQTALWHRIRDFQIDAPDASFPFSSRLARENGWTPAYTQRVIDEYRKFAFLSVAAGHGVTPSKPVDEAWHLHLLYTRNYWEEFCPKALGKPLHHNPSGGNAEDETKYEGWYEQTLASYERLFGGPPPGDIWPSGQQPPKPKRAWWLLFAPTALMLGGCDQPANPLDWQGPDFLNLFFGLYALALFVAFGLRELLRRPADGPPADEWQLPTYEKAFLNEGPDLALATAITNLTARSLLEIDRKKGRIHAIASAIEAKHPLERAVLSAASGLTGANYGTIRRVLKPQLDEMETSLRRQGLWVRGEASVAAVAVPFVVASLPLILGGLKIMVGLDRGRPVGFLVMGCLLGLVVNLMLLRAPKRSRYGDAVLEHYRTTGPQVRHARRGSTHAPDDLALGVALFGLTALEYSDHAYLRRTLVPQQTYSGGDSGSSSSCSGSSSCSSGSSCGGGGGCGGCGGGGD